MGAKRRKKRIVSEEASEDLECAGFEGFPPVPEESRLTVEGAVVGKLGFIKRAAYVDLIAYFANEVDPNLQPFPTTPGINAEEIDMCAGLRTWTDKSGEGWVASSSEKPTKSHRFSVDDWGSWRLAFLLAWLQRAVWCHEEAMREAQAVQEKPQKRKRGRPPVVKSPSRSPTPELDPQRRIRAKREEAVSRVKLLNAKPAANSPSDSKRRGRGKLASESDSYDPAPTGRRLKRLKLATNHALADAEFEANVEEPNEAIVAGEQFLDLSDEEDEPVQEHAIVIDFPPDPEDSRFTVEGALLGDNGKIKVKSYTCDEELMETFANEPPLLQHPDPNWPGLRQSELRDPNIHEIQTGLRSWNDKKGRGWIAYRTRNGGKSESAWISAATLGSWRLALLLARLQILVWRESDSAQDAEVARSPGMARNQVSAPVHRSLADDTTGSGLRGSKKKGTAQVRSSIADEVEIVPSSAGRRKSSPDVKIIRGKKIPPDAKMDPRSKLLQEKRKKHANPTTLGDIDSVIDEAKEMIDDAKERLQIENDLRLVVEASLADSERVGSYSSPELPFADRSPRSSRSRRSSKRKRQEEDASEYIDIEHPGRQAHSPLAAEAPYDEALFDGEEQLHDDQVHQEETIASSARVWGRGVLKVARNVAAPRAVSQRIDKGLALAQQVSQRIDKNRPLAQRGPRTDEDVQATILELLSVDDIL